jgi:hypothetical protein
MRKRILFLVVFVLSVFAASCGKKEITVNIHTELQQKCIADKSTNCTLYAKGTEALDKPEPIEMHFKGNGSDGYYVYLSENEDLSDAKEYKCFGETVTFYNLKVGTTYWYYAKNGEFCTEKKKFVTDGAAPRNLDIGGVINFRDLGGWKTEKGFVKQGLLYRSGKFNADESENTLLTDQGRKEIERLGIKTELDLRQSDNNENGGITESPLGNGVRYISVPLKSGGNIILLNKDKLKELFAVLGNRDNYPMVFHCSIGTDRTGMLAFLVNGLLGVSEDDLYRDFLFSNFAEIGKMRTPSVIVDYKDTVASASGTTLAERIESYLIGAGVEKSDIDALKSILLSGE